MGHVERVPWRELEPWILRSWGWPDGRWSAEHMAILGPTGSGKSHFATTLIHKRVARSGAHAVIVVTKRDDDTLRAMQRKGWNVIRSWPPSYGQSHVLFWPPSGKPSEGTGKQRAAIGRMMDELFKPESNIIVLWDEIAYVEHELRLQNRMVHWWREARTLGLTQVGMTQRPRFVSRYMHSEPSWSVGFGFTDEDDANRVAEIMGNRKEYKPILLSLERYEFLLVQRRERRAFISKMPG
jgi:hypothetical protein